MDQKVTVRLNVLGVDLSEDQVDRVLDQEDTSVAFQRDWLTSFFQLKQSELTNELLRRYVQADVRMARISAGTFEEDIHTRLINTLASAKRCYAYNEFLACIELCALHGEMLANYLCITSKDILLAEAVINQLSQKDQSKIRKHQYNIFFSDMLGQRLRLRWLQNGNVITLEDNAHLEVVHDLRIEYFHRWSSDKKAINENALSSLSEISKVSANHLELLGAKPGEINQKNFDRVKSYMKIITS